jgi:4-diphosphocytidyl-2-C-methyl-D-erythritol kinase
MLERTLTALGLTAAVSVHIQKNLPIQGGMGAGSANAAAALIGLQKELGLDLPVEQQLELAAQVGSDVPLFLIGGSVLGSDRGQIVKAVPDIALAGRTAIPCVVALPRIGVSTPAAFREWDRRFSTEAASDLHNPPIRDTLSELSRTYASVFYPETTSKFGASGIFPAQGYRATHDSRPEKQHGLLREQLHGAPPEEDESGLRMDLPGMSEMAGNTLLALLRNGSGNEQNGTEQNGNRLENDFETVVFPQYPLLREIKRTLMGTSAAGDQAVIAALSGSGSALFGLYRTQADATAAQQRLQQQGVQAIVTATMPRPLYWSNMFAE